MLFHRGGSLLKEFIRRRQYAIADVCGSLVHLLFLELVSSFCRKVYNIVGDSAEEGRLLYFAARCYHVPSNIIVGSRWWQSLNLNQAEILNKQKRARVPIFS